MEILRKRRSLRDQLNDGTSPYIFVGYLLSIIYALIVLIPVCFVFISGFKSNTEIFMSPFELPKTLNLENFIKAQAVARLDRAVPITLAVTVGAELLTLLLAFPAAYAIARIRTPLSRWVELIFSLGFLIPVLAMLVPVFMMVVNVGLLTNPVALILFYPAIQLPMAIILLASYLREVPSELEECAQLDGASRLQMIWYIFIPLARPGLITVIILNFITIWNEYLFSYILMGTKTRTIQPALTTIRADKFVIDYGAIAAGVIMVTLPVFIIYILFQEQIAKGMFAGSVKG